MMKAWLTCCSRGILILLLTAGAAWAQGTAQLSGTVRDESGGVLPGVSVTVTQTNTGLVRTTVTDATGGYLLTNLPTGPYRLEVALQGFKTYVQTGIVLQVGGTPTVNAVLSVGTLEQSVTVEAAAPLVDVRSAGISSVVNNQQILELPLQGRQVTDLIVLAGAAVQTGADGPWPAGRRVHLGRRRPAGRRGLHAGRGGAQQPAEQRRAADAVPRCAPGIPGGDQRALGRQRRQVGRVGQRGDQVGDQCVRTAAASSSCAIGVSTRRSILRVSAPTASSSMMASGATSSAARWAAPSSATGSSSSPATRAPSSRQTPTGNISYVPTAQMLAGDFTTITSPACNSGRQINLGAPFVGNRINPALLSPVGPELHQAPAPVHRSLWPGAVGSRRPPRHS